MLRFNNKVWVVIMTCYLCAKPTCLGECGEIPLKSDVESEHKIRPMTFILAGKEDGRHIEFMDFLKREGVDFVSRYEGDLLVCKGFKMAEAIEKFSKDTPITAIGVGNDFFEGNKSKPKLR